MKYIYPGNHSYLVLHDFLEQLSKTPLEVLELLNDRVSYFLTAKQWAVNFDSNREAIIARFGEFNYRRFRLYLWGAAYEFLSGGMSCYRMILQSPSRLRPDPVPAAATGGGPTTSDMAEPDSAFCPEPPSCSARPVSAKPIRRPR